MRRTSSYPDITRYADTTSETELKLQKQRIVNTELKRLLIASVGDSLANRLEKLGKEKAHLNEQVNILTKQNAADAERIENLVIQGDIWKSKFLAARVVVNELSNWKDNISVKLLETQKNLSHLEEYSKKIFYTLHQADRTLASTIIEISPESESESLIHQRLRDASKCVAELLTNHHNDMYNFNQFTDLPEEPPSTPNMYTDKTHYTYTEIPDRHCSQEDCNHVLSFTDISQTSSVISEEDSFTGLEFSKIKNSNKPISRSYVGCKKSMFVGACKSCAEKEILHL